MDNFNRPVFPKRAIVTSGMPYGNKELHFGHIGGLYVHADTFARFLRDRIGKDNVIFQSGTDCYGSPILEGYRKAIEAKTFDGSINDYVKSNHEKQVNTFNGYEIDLDFFGASSFGESAKFHNEVSAEIFNRLYEVGALTKMEALQFYDEEKQTFLNGRQVLGKCPVEGCKSEKAYADECDLGHQFMPQDLIDPVSALSGKKPSLRKIGNWYFDLGRYTDILKEWVDKVDEDPGYRKYITKEIREFLKLPEIYILKTQMEKFDEIKGSLPAYTLTDDGENKTSITIQYRKLEDREKACEILSSNGIRFRNGKTLVPFRLTGNIEWGVPTPEKEGMKDLTFYVWPESLWAPISFTRTYLSLNNKDTNWKDWWCSDEAKVYQFIGEDNIYFYGPAEMGLFLAMQGENPTIDIPNGEIKIPKIIANKHILFLDKKASSSGSVKPPMAHELLSYYTSEQLRMHFLGMGLGNNNVSFKPKPFNEAGANEPDPVLKEGNLLINVYNRALRQVFNSLKEHYDLVLPYGEVSSEIMEDANKLILEYERLFADQKLHVASNLLDAYVRNINKYWSANSKSALNNNDMDAHKQVMINVIHMIKTANTLLHPMVSRGAERVAKALNLDTETCFDWKYVFEPIYALMDDFNAHKVNEVKDDFFKKHESQLTEEEKIWMQKNNQ